MSKQKTPQKKPIKLSISKLDSIIDNSNDSSITDTDIDYNFNSTDTENEDVSNVEDVDFTKEEELINPDIKNNHIIDFIKVIERSLKNHGAEKITSILKKLDVQSYLQINNFGVIVKYICKCVAKDYIGDNVKEQDLFNKKQRGEVTFARKMAIILIKEFTNISDTKLAKYFGRSRQIIFYTIQDFKAMTPKSKEELSFLNRYDKLSNKVASFIKENNLK